MVEHLDASVGRDRKLQLKMGVRGGAAAKPPLPSCFKQRGDKGSQHSGSTNYFIDCGFAMPPLYRAPFSASVAEGRRRVRTRRALGCGDSEAAPALWYILNETSTALLLPEI